MSVKDLKELGIITPKKSEVTINFGGKELKFIASEIGWLDSQLIALGSSRHGRNHLSDLIAESITDTEGNKFTYEEVQHMVPEVADQLLAAALSVNKKEDAEKK